jgi:endoglucanase
MRRPRLLSLPSLLLFLLPVLACGSGACSSTPAEVAPPSDDGGPSGPTDATTGGKQPGGDGGPGGTKGDATTGTTRDGGDADAAVSCGPSTVDASAVCPASAASGGAYLRFNQVGYRPSDPKHLLLMSPTALAAGAQVKVADGSCANVLTLPLEASADLGSWSASFPHVYDVDVTGLACAGHYTVQVSDGSIAAGAVVDVNAGSALYGPLLSNALFFYKAQRDGANVDATVLSRQPSHLKDQTATVYAAPSYATDGSDVLTAPLAAVSGTGTVDVSGGWFDAGDYLKFVETASYVVAVMLVSARDHASLLSSSGQADFTSEAAFGIDWLLRMWNDDTQMLLYQVGIGNGSSALGITGDHERQWQLPEVDDTLDQSPGNAEYYVEYRPALQAGAAGSAISPNLAGRLAADFGLCAQVYRASNPTLAAKCLRAGEHVFALANTSPPAQLLTAAPFDYYGETSWQEDLELGAAELASALTAAGSASDAGLPQTDPSFYLAQAATWAKAYVASPNDGGDTLNLYDTSALAHYELYDAMKAAGSPSNLAITQQGLLDDLKKQLSGAVTQAKTDPFQLGVVYGANGPDLAPHALGLAVTASFYEQLSGDTQFSVFGHQQRDFVLGANGWGSAFIVGAGTVFPHCLHHRVANLAGALDGTSPILLGAIPDGPSDPANLANLGLPGGAQTCPPAGGDSFAYANGHGAVYQDNAGDWPTVEPADDYTVLSVLLFASASED